MRVRNVHGGMATYPPGAGLAERVMRDFEFVWIIRGEAVWRADGVEHAAGPGAVILSQPGFAEGYRWDPSNVTRHAYFHFELEGVGKELPARAKWPVVRAMPEGDVVRPLFGYVVANLGGGAAVAKAVEAMLMAYVVGPVGAEDAGEEKMIPEAVHRAIQFAATTLGRDPSASIDLAAMADAGSVTPKHLCRLFREHVEMTPMEAVLALRLRHAVQLMARTDFKLERIARECGFATSFHFSRRFRDVYGKPPSEVRVEMASGRFVPPALMRWKGITVEYPGK